MWNTFYRALKKSGASGLLTSQPTEWVQILKSQPGKKQNSVKTLECSDIWLPYLTVLSWVRPSISSVIKVDTIISHTGIIIRVKQYDAYVWSVPLIDVTFFSLSDPNGMCFAWHCCYMPWKIKTLKNLRCFCAWSTLTTVTIRDEYSASSALPPAAAPRSVWVGETYPGLPQNHHLCGIPRARNSKQMRESKQHLVLNKYHHLTNDLSLG